MNRRILPMYHIDAGPLWSSLSLCLPIQAYDFTKRFGQTLTSAAELLEQ